MVEDTKTGFFDSFFSEKTGLYFSLLFFLILFFSILVFLGWGSWEFSSKLDESKIGQFGDFIGGVAGTLVAFIGIILYYVALKEQRKDSQLNQAAFNLQIKTFEQQVQEFSAQRDELITTRRIYEQQTKTMRAQQFDSNFYSLLAVYTSLKSNLNKDVDKDYFEDFHDKIFSSVALIKDDSIVDIHNKVVEQYVESYLNVTSQIAPYFKTIYRILKLIDDCEHFTNKEKLFYCKVIRGQLTDFELLILYYNYHSIYGYSVQGIALKYQLFKHIHPLNKIEFSKLFLISDKTASIRFVEWFTFLVNHNYEHSISIESGLVKIQEKYEPYHIVVSLLIDFEFDIELIVRDNELQYLPMERDTFRNFIYAILYDLLSLSKFEKKINSFVEDSVIEHQGNVIFKYSLHL